MDIEYSANKIKLDKELNSLDEFVLDFLEVLNDLKIKYVIISGYVAILFGRSRSSEDIDIFIEELGFEEFSKLWDGLIHNFECVITDNKKDAYYEYLLKHTAIRFSYKKEFIPNMELKFPKVELEEWVLDSRLEVELNNQQVYISPIEFQIAFKLFLESEKDIEDAKYLYDVLKEYLDMQMLKDFNQKFKVEDIFSMYIE